MARQLKQIKQEVIPEVLLGAEGKNEESELGYVDKTQIKSYLSIPSNTIVSLDQKESLSNKEDSQVTDDSNKYPTLSLLSQSLSAKEDKDSTLLRSTDVVDRLDSQDTDSPLSANQGRIIKSLIDETDSQFVEVTNSRKLKDSDHRNVLSINSSNDVTINVDYRELSSLANFEFTVVRVGTGRAFVNFNKPIHVVHQSGTEIEVFERYGSIRFKYEPNLADWIGWGDVLKRGEVPMPVKVKGTNFNTGSSVSTTADILNFDGSSGLFLEEGAEEDEIKVRLGSHFKTIEVDSQEDVVASGEDTLSITSGLGISLATFPEDNQIDIALEDEGSGLLTKKSSVFVTDVKPFDSSETVNKSTTTDGMTIVDSFDTSTTEVTITIEFDGGEDYRGIYTANGIEFDNYTRISGRYFRATVDLTLNESENEIVIEGNNGETSVTYQIFSSPKITDFKFNLSSYPNGQTELKGGDEVEVFVKADENIDRIEFLDSPAISGQFISVSESDTHTFKIAVKSQPLGQYQGEVIVRSASTGAKSDSFTSTNQVDLNNTHPTVTIDSIDYPSGQQALKDNESAAISITTQDTDSVAVSANDFNVFYNSGTLTAFLETSGHDKDSSSVTITATKSSNKATTTSLPSIKIAHQQTQWQSVPSKQLRTDVDPMIKTINLPFNEPVLEVSLASLEEVAFNSITESNSENWELKIEIEDSNNHQQADYKFQVTVYNLARRETTLEGYFQIKGFFERSYNLNTNETLQLDLGVTVIEETDLVVSSDSPPFNYTLVSSFSADGSEEEFKYLGSNVLEFSEDLQSFLTGNDPPGTVELKVEEL